MVISGIMWKIQKTRQHRTIFFTWSACVIMFIAQGICIHNDVVILTGFSSIYLTTLALSALTAQIINQRFTWRLSLLVMIISYIIGIILSLSGHSFTISAIPVALGNASPFILKFKTIYLKQFRSLTFTGKAFTISTLLWWIHNLDYPFLYNVEEFTAMGFTIATLTMFALSIFVPAVVLEKVTEKEARNAAEIDVARRIQVEILPKNPRIQGFEVECYMKPAEKVGGDYYDICTVGEFSWILLGDVTGHGLHSGLVMLMAQSIISSILHTKKDISPKELNYLANNILFENLNRLNEKRTMTIVSLCNKKSGDQFLYSGSHDNVYIYRKETNEVEIISLGHFPCGLGFLNSLSEEGIEQDTFTLTSGDLLFLGTDGITEAAHKGEYKNGLFDETRLISFLEKNCEEPLNKIKSLLINVLHEFTNGIFHDDVTFVMVRKQ